MSSPGIHSSRTNTHSRTGWRSPELRLRRAPAFKLGHIFQLGIKVCGKRLGLNATLFRVEPQRRCAGALSETLRGSQGASAVQFSQDASTPSMIGQPHSLQAMTVHVISQPEQVASSGSTVRLAPWLS